MDKELKRDMLCTHTFTTICTLMATEFVRLKPRLKCRKRGFHKQFCRDSLIEKLENLFKYCLLPLISYTAHTKFLI